MGAIKRAFIKWLYAKNIALLQWLLTDDEQAPKYHAPERMCIYCKASKPAGLFSHEFNNHLCDECAPDLELQFQNIGPTKTK